MPQNKRILLGLLILVVAGGIVFAIEYFRGRSSQVSAGEVLLAPGSVPVYRDGTLVAGIVPGSLENLQQVSFTDAEEGKPQDGWLLRDVLLAALDEQNLPQDSLVTISSASRNKAIQLTWVEIETEENRVMFDLSNRGTLKLVSLLEKLDTRDEWIQDVDKIEIVNP